MLEGDAVGLLLGAVGLGAVHGIEPGHGWPVAASYALDQTNKWLYGLAASLLIGIGHLISSIAMVGAFFYAKSYFSLTQVNEPVTILDGVTVGGPVSLVAGGLLVVLGVREYLHGHAHGHSEDGHDHTHAHDHAHDGDGHVQAQVHDHSHDGGSHDHSPAHDHAQGGVIARLRDRLSVGGAGDLADDDHDAADRGLLGIAWFAFLLGFAHEEEFEIIALCAGSVYCLELMLAYAVTVILGIVGLTMLLIAGYQHYEERVRRYTPYLPVFSAAVLIGMGLGFITGLL